MDACRFLFFDNLFFDFPTHSLIARWIFLGTLVVSVPSAGFSLNMHRFLITIDASNVWQLSVTFSKCFYLFCFFSNLYGYHPSACFGALHDVFWMIFWISTSLLGPVTMVRSSSVSSVLATIDIFLKIIAASSLLGVLSYHELNSRYIMFGQCFGLNFLVKSLQIWSDLKTISDDIGTALKLS